MKPLRYFIHVLPLVFAGVALPACVGKLPSSTQPGQYSAYTSLPILGTSLAWPDNLQPIAGRPTVGSLTILIENPDPPAYKGFKDDAVAHTKKCQVAPATPLGILVAQAQAKNRQSRLLGPGVVELPGVQYMADECEISNLEWQQFIRYLAFEGQDTLAARMWPQRAALPHPEYFTDPFYLMYPVVGVSYEQAQAYCRWRSRQISLRVQQGLPGRAGLPLDTLHPDFARFTYRLPTEAEWEYIASAGLQQPYAMPCLEQPTWVNPAAALYIKQRAGITQSVDRVKSEILEFNRSKVSLPTIRYRWTDPKFMLLTTPDYIYGLAPTPFGLFQLAGNVAEMVQERGITKGGSYLDPLEACRTKARGTYRGPASSIGFRCVCEVAYPNRK